ncbi:MAG: S1 RNA-binding domain-containing protein [Candidatus Liptonbacteria bacterium]|nr:S1 RNA-binding domain-containing protein [Candidatus Liptonbacteria bacterium]
MAESANNKPAQSTLLDALKNTIPPSEWPKEGSVAEVKLLRKTDRKVFFDMGKFGTGIVWGAELLNAREMVKDLKAGDACLAKIKAIESDEGFIELSLAEAGRERLWQQAREFLESGELVKVKVVGANAGGLTATLFDLKAFLPVSQLSQEHYPRVEDGDRQKIFDELKKFIGQELTVKVIDVNPRHNKFILSEREVVSGNVKELLKKYKTGDEIQGLVTGIADFGAFVRFVDEPQLEGLIHISELAHALVDNPKDVLKVDETVKAKIIDIREDGRVFLSLKALQADPWTTLGDRYKKGDEVEGKGYKLNPFGAIVDLGGGIQGTVHIAEFESADTMKKILTPGGTHRFVVETVKPEEKRIVLKLKK